MAAPGSSQHHCVGSSLQQDGRGKEGLQDRLTWPLHGWNPTSLKKVQPAIPRPPPLLLPRTDFYLRRRSALLVAMRIVRTMLRECAGI